MRFKILLTLIIIFCFSSCTRRLGRDSAFVVEEIDLLNKYEAIYTMADRNKISGNWLFEIQFIDSINKYSVGDTIRFR